MSLLMLTRCLACAVALFAGCSSPSQKKPMTLQEMISADPLPLAKGAKWTYNVTVKRFDHREPSLHEVFVRTVEEADAELAATAGEP